jgi:hypothetical protein
VGKEDVGWVRVVEKNERRIEGTGRVVSSLLPEPGHTAV